MNALLLNHSQRTSGAPPSNCLEDAGKRAATDPKRVGPLFQEMRPRLDALARLEARHLARPQMPFRHLA